VALKLDFRRDVGLHPLERQREHSPFERLRFALQRFRRERLEAHRAATAEADRPNDFRRRFERRPDHFRNQALVGARTTGARVALKQSGARTRWRLRAEIRAEQHRAPSENEDDGSSASHAALPRNVVPTQFAAPAPLGHR
jgi:hypothetical protein